MKDIVWLGQTYKDVKSYPKKVKREIGFNLDRLQRGLEPCDWKNLVGLGQGIQEIRIHEMNEYRVVYIAKFAEAIYILHSFVKKTQQTSHKDIELIKNRYAEILALRNKK